MRLLLFTTDTEFAARAERAGIDGVIVDWESRGKGDRQQGRDLETNADTVEDARRLSVALTIPVTVRVNGPGSQVEEEVDRALESGARGLMFPMARGPEDVERFLAAVRGCAETIVQIETQALVDRVEAVRGLPWDSVYIGLNDLMVSRGGTWIWETVLDGTVERVCRALEGRKVGFGGVTVVGGGFPVRFSLLLQEMVRLGCDLSFMRRTFKREIQDRDMAAEVRAIRALEEAFRKRGPEATAADHRRLLSELQRLREISDANPADVRLR
jgi:hypothetical protein